jgi:hypothetical protein
MDEESEEYQLDKYTQNKLAEEKRLIEEEKELKIKWRQEIEQNKEIQAHLDKYRKSSVDAFITHYVNHKYQVYRYGDMYIKLAEDERTKWIDLAHEQLKCIQQKQLFDLQCQWRAEQIKLNGVEKCIDFKKWEEDILNCPFLKPISESDIELYQEFLTKFELDFANQFWNIEWQDYDEIKGGYDEDSEETSLPEWYQFHYKNSETSSLLLLPDIRGEKEEFYRRIWFDNQRKEIEEKQKDQPIKLTDNRPYLSASDRGMMSFLFSNFEDQLTQKRDQYYRMAIEEYSDTSSYEDMFRELAEANEDVPIEGHFDIKEAVEMAYNSYYAKKTAEHLPLAYEQYLLTRKMGFVIKGERDYFGDLDDIYTKSILGGRELNGEPRDFNF